MGIAHKAYTFDPKSFHNRLEQKVIVGDSLDLNRFQEFAKEVVQNADEETMEVLNILGFDDEWLDNPEDYWSGDEWYMVALTESLRKAPSLSNRMKISYRVLEMTLALTGWRSGQIARLLTGDNLRTLISASQCRPLIHEYCGSIYYGGWINNDLLNIFLGLLHKTKSTRERLKAALVGAISDWCNSIGIEPESALHAAYADAEDMLNTAAEINEALFVSLYD